MTTALEARARWVSDEVLALSGRGPLRGEVQGRFSEALHVDLEGFVVAVLPEGAPRMPNGLATASGGAIGKRPRPGAPAVLRRGRLIADRLEIAWDAERPPRWDARVPRGGRVRSGPLRGRAEAILGTHAAGPGPGELAAAAMARIGADREIGRPSGALLAELLATVRSGDPDAASRASRRLVGRGPGLTPIGDDMLAAAALTVAALDPGRRGAGSRSEWLSALLPADLHERTTAVSATLLELAVRGRGIAPAHPLLAPEPLAGLRLAEHLDRMRRLGHTTGVTYAAVIAAATLMLLPAELPQDPRQQEETR